MINVMRRGGNWCRQDPLVGLFCFSSFDVAIVYLTEDAQIVDRRMVVGVFRCLVPSSESRLEPVSMFEERRCFLDSLLQSQLTRILRDSGVWMFILC